MRSAPIVYIYQLGKRSMKITTIALVVAIPFLSCGTIISPDPKTEKLAPPAITSNKTISATNPVITIDSSPSKNTSKNIDTTKNYLEISDT